MSTALPKRDSLLDRETLRRGCLALESAALEESFCVWRLVRFLSRHHLFDLEQDNPDQKNTSKHTRRDSAIAGVCRSPPPKPLPKPSSINHAYIAHYGRAAVRGAQATTNVWALVATLAHVLVCGPEHVVVVVDAAATTTTTTTTTTSSYDRRLAELQAQFDDERAQLDRFCAEHADTPLFSAGCDPSSTTLLRRIQQRAAASAQHLRGLMSTSADTTADTTADACAALLLRAALDMASASGTFLDHVSRMIFATGESMMRPVPKTLQLSSPPPPPPAPKPKTLLPPSPPPDEPLPPLPLTEVLSPAPPPPPSKKLPPPDILSKATTTTRIIGPETALPVGEKAPVRLPPQMSPEATLRKSVCLDRETPGDAALKETRTAPPPMQTTSKKTERVRFRDLFGKKRRD